MQGHGSKLPLKQEETIVALLASPTIEQAAKKVGVAPSTLFRWMQDEEFKANYRVAKTACVFQAIAHLQNATLGAVDTLRDIMLDEGKPPATRVVAAKIVLETSIKAVEIEDLAARVEQLEKALNHLSGK